MSSKNNNTVTLTASDFSSITYISQSLVITSGQPSDEPASIANKASNWVITIDCGCKGSNDVASKWVEATGGANNSFAPDGGGSPPPKSLNFYYGLEVSTKAGNKTTLYLGQGNHSDINNWWVGGGDVVAIGNKAALTFGSGATREVYDISGTHDSLTFFKR